MEESGNLSLQQEEEISLPHQLPHLMCHLHQQPVLAATSPQNGASGVPHSSRAINFFLLPWTLVPLLCCLSLKKKSKMTSFFVRLLLQQNLITLNNEMQVSIKIRLALLLLTSLCDNPDWAAMCDH
jgi:hypothetical protein